MAKVVVKVGNPDQDKQPKPAKKVLVKVKKDTSPSLDVIEKQIDTNLPTDEANAKAFFNHYLNSPLYKQRLIKQGYNDPQRVINERIKNLNNTTSVKKYGGDTGYTGGSKTIEVNPITFQFDPNSKLKNVMGHELSHAAGAINPADAYYSARFSNPGMNENDYTAIQKRNKLKDVPLSQLTQYMRGIYSSVSPALVAANKDAFREHDLQPNESKADLDALRFMLYQDKIYDAGKQPFTKELLQKAKTKYSDTQSKRLFKNFSDDDIIWMMNNIAKNNTSNPNDGTTA